MTVYVDDMHKWSMGHFGRMKMSHMIADTDKELHKMAKAIGVARKHFQDKGSAPHYDIAKSKRALALQNGAVAITLRQCSRMCFIRRVEGGKLPRPKKVDIRWNELQGRLRFVAEREHGKRDFIRARQAERKKPKIKRLRLNTGDDNGLSDRRKKPIPKMRLGGAQKAFDGGPDRLPPPKLSAVPRVSRKTKRRQSDFF